MDKPTCQRRKHHHHTLQETLQEQEQEQEQELLLLLLEDARVKRIAAIRREIIADIRAIEARVKRLSFDLRRLDPLHLHPFRPGPAREQEQEQEQSSSGLLPVSRALAVMEERSQWFVSLGLLDGESRERGGLEKGKRMMGIREIGMGMIDKEHLLRVFIEALSFVDEACGVMSFCERCIAKWNCNPHRGAECSAEIRRALYAYFPGVNTNSRILHTDTIGFGEEKWKRVGPGTRDLSQKGEGYGMTEEEMFQRLIREVEVVPYRIEEPLRWRNYSTYH